MREIFVFISIFLFYSCNPSNNSISTELTQAEKDSFAIAKYGKSEEEVVQDMVKETIKKALFDTIGLYKSPIKVLSAKMIEKEYSNYRDISVTFKNVSGKTIEGIRFMWYGETAFKEPADMGMGVYAGFGSGATDRKIRSKKSMTLEWDVSSRNAKKIILAWPYEVVFSDGTTWKLK